MKIILKIFLICFILSGCTRNNIISKSDISVTIDSISSLPKNKREKILDSVMDKLTGIRMNDSIKRALILKISGKYFNEGIYEKYALTTRKLYNLSVEKKDTFHIATALYYLGDYYDTKYKSDSSLYYYIQAEKLFRNLRDTVNTGKLQLYKAGILYDSGNYYESEVETVKALKLLTKSKNSRLVYECYILIALSLKEQNNFTEALEYFDLALMELNKLQAEESEDSINNSKASCYNNIGLVYEKKNEFGKAIAYYKKGLQTDGIEKGKPYLYAMLLNNLAYSQMQIGIKANTQSLLFKSLSIRDSLNIKPGIVSSKIRIGQFYLWEKDTVKALLYLKQGLQMAKEIKSHYDILHSLKLISEIDKSNKAYYTNQYFKVSDSLRSVEKSTRNKFARIAYETDVAEEKNTILIKQNHFIALALFIAIILFSVLSVLLKLRSKNKDLIHTQYQQEATEEIYKLIIEQHAKVEDAQKKERNRIAMELHDGIVNRIFTTRFNLMQLISSQTEFKDQLVSELTTAEDEIRAVSHNLKENSNFEDRSFSETITQLITKQQNRYHTVFDVYIDKYIDWQMIQSHAKMHLFRIIQELIQNVNKYSRAQFCNVFFFKIGDKIKLEVSDDGIGFDTKSLKSGIGLKNIMERINELEGEIIIESSPLKGTKITILIAII